MRSLGIVRKIDELGRIVLPIETRKRLGLPIPFIIIPDLNEDDCSRLNKYNTKWEIEDWVNSWAKNENKEIANNYILFKEKNLDMIQKRIRTLITGLANCGLDSAQTSNEDLRMIIDNFLNGGMKTEFGTVVSQ